MDNTDGKDQDPHRQPLPDLSEMARLVVPELRRMLREKGEREKENGDGNR